MQTIMFADGYEWVAAKLLIQLRAKRNSPAVLALASS